MVERKLEKWRDKMPSRCALACLEDVVAVAAGKAGEAKRRKSDGDSLSAVVGKVLEKSECESRGVGAGDAEVRMT